MRMSQENFNTTIKNLRKIKDLATISADKNLLEEILNIDEAKESLKKLVTTHRQM
jgi:hypothetical protein